MSFGSILTPSSHRPYPAGTHTQSHIRGWPGHVYALSSCHCFGDWRGAGDKRHFRSKKETGKERGSGQRPERGVACKSTTGQLVSQQPGGGAHPDTWGGQDQYLTANQHTAIRGGLSPPGCLEPPDTACGEQWGTHFCKFYSWAPQGAFFSPPSWGTGVRLALGAFLPLHS